MKHQKRKTATPDGDVPIASDRGEDAAQYKSYVLTEDDDDYDDHNTEPAKKVAKTDTATAAPCYHSSSSSSSSMDDEDDDELKQPDTDVVMCISFSSSSTSPTSPAQHEVFTKDQYVLLILSFLDYGQRILVEKVNHLFQRCGPNGKTSAPQLLCDDNIAVPAEKVAKLYRTCVELTLSFKDPAYAADRYINQDQWRIDVLAALSLDHLHTLNFRHTKHTNISTWQPELLIALAKKTPKLTALCIRTQMEPDVVRAFLEGPRADKLQCVVLSLATSDCLTVFTQCVPALQSVHKLHLLCDFSSIAEMSSLLLAIRVLPTLSELVLEWHDNRCTIPHFDALRFLLTKHKHTLQKIGISAGAYLSPDFSLWLLKWAGESMSLVDFSANTYYNEECIRTATDTVTRLSDQLQHFHIGTYKIDYWNNPPPGIRSVSGAALTEFVAACNSAPRMIDCSIEEVLLPVRDLRNGCVSPKLSLPGGTIHIPLVEVARLYGIFFDGCASIKRVTFTSHWKTCIPEEAIVDLMRRLPAVEDLCGHPRTCHLTDEPSAFIPALLAHPTWTTVSIPQSDAYDGIVVHTKKELADQTRPLELLHTSLHNWTICALASRAVPSITIDTSRFVIDQNSLVQLQSSMNKPVHVNIVCTGPRTCDPKSMMDFVDNIAELRWNAVRWTENSAPFPLIAIAAADQLVIRSSMTSTFDYLLIRNNLKHNDMSQVLLVYDSVDQLVDANDVFAFYRDWIKILEHRHRFVSCRLEVKGPASLLSPVGMHPFGVLCDTLCYGLAEVVYVGSGDDQFRLSTQYVGHYFAIRLQAKGAFMSQLGPTTDFDVGRDYLFTRRIETLDVVVESLEELAGCVWCTGHGTETTFRMCVPESSLEQFEEASERFEALITPCIADQTKRCFGYAASFAKDTEGRTLVCTVKPSVLPPKDTENDEELAAQEQENVDIVVQGYLADIPVILDAYHEEMDPVEWNSDDVYMDL
jgi:hypothetical protein